MNPHNLTDHAAAAPRWSMPRRTDSPGPAARYAVFAVPLRPPVAPEVERLAFPRVLCRLL